MLFSPPSSHAERFLSRSLRPLFSKFSLLCRFRRSFPTRGIKRSFYGGTLRQEPLLGPIFYSYSRRVISLFQRFVLAEIHYPRPLFERRSYSGFPSFSRKFLEPSPLFNTLSLGIPLPKPPLRTSWADPFSFFLTQPKSFFHYGVRVALMSPPPPKIHSTTPTLFLPLPIFTSLSLRLCI